MSDVDGSMSGMEAMLSCAVTTMVEWRRQDGAVLHTAVLAGGTMTNCVLITEWPIEGVYDVYARPHQVGADWERVFEIDPVKRTVARFDL